MDVPELVRETRWSCPNCTTTSVTHEARPHTRMHPCKGIGLDAPLVEDGVDCKVVATVRDDFVGDELGLRYDPNGRPIMNVSTVRADGSNDVAVFAPLAVGDSFRAYLAAIDHPLIKEHRT